MLWFFSGLAMEHYLSLHTVAIGKPTVTGGYTLFQWIALYHGDENLCLVEAQQLHASSGAAGPACSGQLIGGWASGGLVVACCSSRQTGGWGGKPLRVSSSPLAVCRVHGARQGTLQCVRDILLNFQQLEELPLHITYGRAWGSNA